MDLIFVPWISIAWTLFAMQYFKSPKEPPTKDAKQIVMENSATIKFYACMPLAAASFHGSASILVHNMENLTAEAICLNILVLSISTGCYLEMKYISRPTYSEDGHLIDPGLDLNKEGGLGEFIKDVVAVSSITHVLASASNMFWWLLLFLPLRAFWVLCDNKLAPFFCEEAALETEEDENKEQDENQEQDEKKEQNEKKKKKMERKIKKYKKL